MSLLILAAACASEPAPPVSAETPGVQPQKPESKLPSDPAGRPIILAFGDSLTQGYGVPAGDGYPEQLQKVLDGRGYAYRVVNQGVSGETTGGGLARLQSAVRLKPAIVILELGANDGLQGLPTDATRSNLNEMITAFQKDGAKVLLAGMTLPRNFGGDYIKDFEGIFPALAKKHRITLIPFFLEGAAGHREFILEDGLHPNAEGYRVIVQMLMKYLEPLLKRE